MYNNAVDLEFDPAKDRANIAKHGVSLALAADFDFQTAIVDLDDRYDYGEHRMVGLGFIDERLFVLVFVETATGIRAISLRNATRTESRRYAEESPPA